MINAIMCLATAVFFEARSEQVDAQIFVAEVVMNRVEDSRYPDNVCDVVFEEKAFSFTHDGLSDNMNKYDTYLDAQAKELAISIAHDIYHRDTPLITSTHYYAVTIEEPFWAAHYEFDGVYGGHVFFTNETPWK